MTNFSKSTAHEALNNYTPKYENEKITLEKMKNFLEKHENFAYRTNLVGHFTGSAWVVNHDFTEALLIHHVKLNKWLQPGGHFEMEDTSFLDGAMREAREEIGIEGFRPVSNEIFDIDIHKIPEKNSEPEHEHLDVRYILTIDNMDTSQIDAAEVHGAKWIPIDELLSENIEESIRRMAEKTKKLQK